MHDGIFQALAWGLFGTGMVVSGYYRHRADRHGGALALEEEGALWRGLRRLVGVLGLSVFGLALVGGPQAAWMHLALPEGVRWLGVGMAAVTLPILVAVLRHLGLNITKTPVPRQGATLVTSGPYAWVRHPLYSAGFLQVVGLGLMLANWPILVLSAVALLFLVERSDLEEHHLLARFGPAYAAYQLSTGRLVPRSLRHLNKAVTAK